MRRVAVRAVVAAGMAVVFVSVLTGISAGSAGSALIIGRSNDAGKSNTSLTANTSGNSFVLYQKGTGSALRGWQKNTTASGNGVSATASSPSGNGVFADNEGGSNGGGAAMVGVGGPNWGVVGTTTGQVPAVGVQGEDDSGSVNGNGVAGLTFGNGLGTAGIGLGGGTLTGTGGFFATDSDNSQAWGLVASGCTTFSGSTCTNDQAAQFNGDVEINGNLNVTGTCCLFSAMAVNGSGTAIRRGDAVMVIGAKAVSGRTMIVVAPARAGQNVIGIADSGMVGRSVTVRGFSAASRVHGLGRLQPRTTTQTRYFDGGSTVRPGALLRVITSGLVTFAKVDARAGAIRAGASLGVGSTAGSLEVAKTLTVQGQSFTIPGVPDGCARDRKGLALDRESFGDLEAPRR